MSQQRMHNAETDAELVRKVAQGDRTALATLYECYASVAYSLAVRLVGEGKAADVVHDAFVALVSRGSTYDVTRGSFRSWFMTSVHHRCVNELRRRELSTLEPVLDALVANQPDPVDTIIRELEDAAVRSALEQLPSDLREPLVLAYFAGFSQASLSEHLGIPVGTVKSRTRRALIAMKDLLSDQVADRDRERRS